MQYGISWDVSRLRLMAGMEASNVVKQDLRVLNVKNKYFDFITRIYENLLKFNSSPSSMRVF